MKLLGAGLIWASLILTAIVYSADLKKRVMLLSSTIIMISHDVLAAIKYATHILHIGKEIFFGTKDEYMNSSVFKKFGGV